MRPILVLPTLAVLALSAPAQGADFGAFLAGMDDACDRSPAFATFWRSLIARYGEDGPTAAPLVFPPDVAAALGPTRVKDEGDYFDVRMDASGTFRGLKMSRLVFWTGKGNGIGGYRVEFAEPPGRVRSVLGPAVARGKKRLAADGEGGGPTTGLDFSGGVSAIYCDLSN